MTGEKKEYVKKYVSGMYLNDVSKMPQFILESLSFNVEKFTKYMEENKDQKGYVKIDICISKKTDHKQPEKYLRLNEWRPTPKTESQPSLPIQQQQPIQTQAVNNVTTDGVPF